MVINPSDVRQHVVAEMIQKKDNSLNFALDLFVEIYSDMYSHFLNEKEKMRTDFQETLDIAKQFTTPEEQRNFRDSFADELDILCEQIKDSIIEKNDIPGIKRVIEILRK